MPCEHRGCRAPVGWLVAVYGQWTRGVCDLHLHYDLGKATAYRRAGETTWTRRDPCPATAR